jgi:hypothetical protein
MKALKKYFLSIALLVFSSTLFGGASWKSTYAKSGECHIEFPSPPEMIQQSMQVSEAGHRLLYDIYLAPFQDRGVFLLLIATYPGPLNQGNEMAGLEGLVKGITSHHMDNQLVFSNSVEFLGLPAINFLVQSGANYFRGHAFMVGNKLYLIAMEGRKGELDEATFNRFMNSFKFLNR